MQMLEKEKKKKKSTRGLHMYRYGIAISVSVNTLIRTVEHENHYIVSNNISHDFASHNFENLEQCIGSR